MRNKILFIFILCINIQFAKAQLTLDGELRPRTEYRHGFGSLIEEDADPGFAVSTRARLNVGYKQEAYEFYLSLQDVFVWGENRQLRPDDENNSFAIFQAWTKIKLGNGWSTKLGRQIISYDDQRIFGGVDWTQQARNHDAALLKYNKEKLSLDVGLAFSQDFDNPAGFQSVGNTFNTLGFFTYKTMQYAYVKNKWDNLTGSFLLLNNGFQNFDDDGNGDGVSNLQTLGTHLAYKKDKFNANFNGFIQTGERQGELDVKSAYLLGLELGYKTSDKVILGLGAELISGNDGEDAGETGAFFPLFGTNHKFNGFLDFFFVGNHANSVGLFDIHASAKINTGNDSSLLVKVLNFSGAEELPSGDKALGTEVDLVYTKKFKGYTLAAGYSHMFASDGLYELSGIAEDDGADIQNWAWLQLTFKPKFLNTSKSN